MDNICFVKVVLEIRQGHRCEASIVPGLHSGSHYLANLSLKHSSSYRKPPEVRFAGMQLTAVKYRASHSKDAPPISLHPAYMS